MEYVGWFAFGLVVIRFLVALFNWITRPYLPLAEAQDYPLVSVLIPARNEAVNLPALLHSLSKSSYRNLEVLVYDDASTDTTVEVANSFAAAIPLRVIHGIPLPVGWLGKGHACHRLSLEAKGEYLLFLDADVSIEPNLVGRLVAFSRKEKLALISVFPFQEMVTRGERLAVPIMNWILVSLLPLALVRLTRKVSLSAANGQLMFFDAAVYRQNSWHQQVKSIRVEDIAIARLVKQRGYTMATLLGRGEVTCRMYAGYDEAVAGLTRSVFAFFGNNLFFMVVFTFFSTFGFLIVFLTLPWFLGVTYVSLAILTRAAVSLASKQSALFNVVNVIHQHYAFVSMVAKSLLAKFKGKTEWKGREISA